ncbi:DUF2787 family protein [Vibrio harveyi]|uniref:DUF2787 family protein n=1 Tax=Vibrio harveyi TaxID=669 RepID=UPI0012AE9EE5|nr:DUF2787 family protein [Vibrio harveyi]
MSNVLKEIASAFQLASLHQLTELILSCYHIPEDSKRVVLNFKVSSFYTERCGIQPVEIQLERATPDSPWELRFIATFDYPDEQAESVDVALYFNFKYRWFYQPDIERCELFRPEVIALFIAWLKAFIGHLQDNQFDTQTLKVVSRF